MAIGGGAFSSQTKLLPGAYVNFVSSSHSSNRAAERGCAAIAMSSDWGPECTISVVNASDFMRNSQLLTGYSLNHPASMGLYDMFLHAETALIWRFGGGTYASCEFATAKYTGIRGNDLAVSISQVSSTYQIDIFIDNDIIDSQIISSMDQCKDNDFVIFNKNASISITSMTKLRGGSNGTESIDSHQKFLSALESRTFNTIACLSTDNSIKLLYAQFTRRMRNDTGVKFQCVMYRAPESSACRDREDIISLYNEFKANSANPTLLESYGVFWVTGAQAGCQVNRSLTNALYDGSYIDQMDVTLTQSQLESSLVSGDFAFHLCNEQIRVLEDINTFVNVTDLKSIDFSYNQTIRVLDQIATDIAAIFSSKYMGSVPNDTSGRISLWNDIVTHHQKLVQTRAIENFHPEDVKVTQGDSKRAVVVTEMLTPSNAMSQLYMTIIIQ